MFYRALIALTLFLMATLPLAGQIPPISKSDEDTVIRVDTDLVDVPILVTDRSGKPVLNLKQKNFVVYEDNKRQEIADFAATGAPFEVALLLDTSGSARSELDLIKRAAQSFIDSLRPGDRVSITAFKTQVDGGRSMAVPDVLCKLTDDRLKLRSCLAKASTSNGTPYYDSLLKIVGTVFEDEPKEQFRGRRALVALTDGVDSTSASEFDEARDVFEAAGIISFFIKVDTRPFFEESLLGDCESAMRFSQAQLRRYYRKFYAGSNIERVTNFCQLGDFERMAISKKLYDLAELEMAALAKKSGGRVFPVGELNEARSAFKSVADEIGTKYSLGYYSTNDKHDGTFRRIKIELRDLPPGSQVRAREGYTAPTR